MRKVEQKQMSTKTYNRREALATMATLTGGAFFNPGSLSLAAAKAPSGYRPKLSMASYIFIQRFETEKKPLADGVEEMLSTAHRAGFRRVELTAEFLTAELRSRTFALLKQNKLELPTVYAGSTMHEPQAADKSIREIVDLAEAIKPAGVKAIVTNPSPMPQHAQKSEGELSVQVRALNRLGSELRKRDMELMIHHHTPELVDNAREWRYELAHTDPSVVACCVDVDWAVHGGQQPVPFMREAGSRLASLHLRNTSGGVWLEDFSDGDIDYHKVADYLKQISFKGYLVVELAYEKQTRVTRSLEEDLRLSRQYAQRVFGLS
jgi:inosose dehydratase